MGDLLFYIAALAFVIALIVLGGWVWRTLVENGVSLPGGQFLKPSREKRIGAVETASIDGRRKLILIRRDNVEHLILTGGPIDLVVETGIPVLHAAYNGAPAAYAPQGPNLEQRLFRNRGEGDPAAYGSGGPYSQQ